MALPALFLTWVDRYLYYLRPLELVPTYATAWLLLAVATVPLSLVSILLLKALESVTSLSLIRRGLELALLALPSAAIVAALFYAVVLWLRTFGLLLEFPVERAVVILSLGLVALGLLTRRGANLLDIIHPIARYGAALGALSLVCLPFSGWHTGSQSTPAAADHPPRPHVLLVTIDALSASHMSLYGAARETTPNLEAFALGATTFDRAYANANFTTPGVSSILTATRPWVHRALQLPSWPVAEARRESLPALLRQAGYLTAYFGTNPFASPVRNGMGTYFVAGHGDRVPGFSFCSDWLSEYLPYDCPAAALASFNFAERLLNAAQRSFARPPNWHFDPRRVSGSALEWLAAADKSTPIFLWVHFLPPHSPYAAPAPWLGQFDSSAIARDAVHSEAKDAFLFGAVPPAEAHAMAARYDESVKYVDHYVGEFLTRASAILGDNTVVIVTADHGESFEHGYGAHTGPGLYEPLIHIPLLMKLPFQTQALRTSAPVEQVDIGPTVAALAGFAPPDSWEGHSLQDPHRADQPIFAMNFEENRRHSALTTGSIAVIDGHWKLVQYRGALRYPKMPELRDTLYDLETDPGELTNRIADNPAEAGHLSQLIATELTAHGAALP